MIDIENTIVDAVFNAVKAPNAFPDADVTTGFDMKTAVFPCVVIEEVNNAPLRSTDTDDCAENYTRLVYEVSVYTDNLNKAKSEGRKILGIVDDTLQGLKFRRVRTNQPLHISRSVFRQYARWEVVVGKPIIDGDRVIYQMYRR